MTGKIFINYRRGDDQGSAGRLFDRLETTFAPDRLFMDVDSIPPGQDFVRVLGSQVEQCDVFLAIIGPSWIDAKDANGRHRLDNPDDFVRIEIESALRHGKLVIPILINGAQMPRPDQLTESLRPLARLNAVRLTHERFRSDVQGLIKVVTSELREDSPAAAPHVQSNTTNEQQKERVRLAAIAGLDPEQIRKAEELANWDFIKNSNRPADFRDHLARFADGSTQRMARTRLEDLSWAVIGPNPRMKDLKEFLTEFPDGAHSTVAKRRLKLFSSFLERRISRQSYWFVSLITVPTFIIGLSLASLVSEASITEKFILIPTCILLFAPAWLITHWRSHDNNRGSVSAIAVILLTIIIAGGLMLGKGALYDIVALPIWLLFLFWVILGIPQGTVGANRYGGQVLLP